MICCFVEEGYNLIVMVGFLWVILLGIVVVEYFDINFIIIDMVVDLLNVCLVVFNEYEGLYLVGMLVVMVVEDGIVSFVGGMDILLICKFVCGYV